MTPDDQPLDNPGSHDSRHDANRPGVELIDCAGQVEDAVRRLAHLTLGRPSLTPAEVDTVLGHLAESLAALPQVATQLGDILDRTRDTHLLAMDGMSTTTEPDLALDTARLHLDELRGPAVETYRHLNAARNEVTHISATPLADDPVAAEPSELMDRHRRHEHHQPLPAAGPARRGPVR